MFDTGTHRRTSTPVPFRSLLVASDLSASSDRAVGRVAQLPLADDARITLLHVLPEGLPSRLRRHEEAIALEALEEDRRKLARRLHAFEWIRTVVRVGAAATEIAKRVVSLESELLVLGTGGGDTLRRTFLGSTAERVMRRSRVPVLATRIRPSAPYRRPAIAIDNEGSARDELVALLRLLGTPRPIVDVINAFEMPYGGLIYRRLPDHERANHLERYRHRAIRALEKTLISSLSGLTSARERHEGWRTHVETGSPRGVILESVTDVGSDILVLGSHAYRGASRALFGTVAGDVLRSVKCDVLMVPSR
jgi:nucleotide-binding universal stress UspA family protein